MRFGLSDLEELPSLKEFEALAREALGSDEGVAPSAPSDESVLDAPQSNAAPETGAESAEPSEQAAAAAPEETETVSDSQPTQEASAEEAAAESEEQAHKTAAAGE